MAVQRGGLKRKSKVASEIPDSSLADIAFLLLIFFMVTTVFPRERKREVVFPDAQATERVDERRRNIMNIWVEQNGEIYINDQLVPAAQVSNIAAREYAETSRRLVVSIRGDRNVPYQIINEVTEQLRDANALRVNFATTMEQRITRARR
jgi:biopolymer transport protein ExbD